MPRWQMILPQSCVIMPRGSIFLFNFIYISYSTAFIRIIIEGKNSIIKDSIGLCCMTHNRQQYGKK